ncbi:MAG TPA: helix-turn-helix transcriptional regulator [Pseudolabrys sp.]|nr:helix-turn-helix transcriptional regulator [Pseudolabrys sp.]
MSTEIDLKALRKRYNWTQAELAARAGVDVATVWRWENEGLPKRGPARAFLEHLAADAPVEAAA